MLDRKAFVSVKKDTLHYLKMARAQLATARDGLHDAINHPERKERGLRVAIEFARGVGEALRHLKTRVDGYEDWWSAAKGRHLDHPVCKYLYDLRTEVFHDGTLKTGRMSVVRDLRFGPNSEMSFGGQSVVPPAGFKSLAFGDSEGRDGWVDPATGKIARPIDVPGSVTYLSFADAPPEFRYRPATDSLDFYLSRLGDLIEDAEKAFARS
jgi:hypothetical protein